MRDESWIVSHSEIVSEEKESVLQWNVIIVMLIGVLTVMILLIVTLCVGIYGLPERNDKVSDEGKKESQSRKTN